MKNMTKKTNSALLISLVASAFVFSIPQVMAYQPGGHHGGKGNAFNHMDSNQDALLSTDEMTSALMAKSERSFSRKDQDQDDLLSLEEFSQTRRGSGTDLSDIGDDIVQCVTDIKAETGDVNITVPSSDQFMSKEQKFTASDSSADGFISMDEVAARVDTKVAASFEAMDLDLDGMVSQAEFDARNEQKAATRSVIRQCVSEITADDIV